MHGPAIRAGHRCKGRGFSNSAGDQTQRAPAPAADPGHTIHPHRRRKCNFNLPPRDLKRFKARRANLSTDNRKARRAAHSRPTAADMAQGAGQISTRFQILERRPTARKKSRFSNVRARIGGDQAPPVPPPGYSQRRPCRPAPRYPRTILIFARGISRLFRP